jgi:hypothetical protein
LNLFSIEFVNINIIFLMAMTNAKFRSAISHGPSNRSLGPGPSRAQRLAAGLCRDSSTNETLKTIQLRDVG